MPENTGFYNKYTVIDNRTGQEVTDRTWTLNIDTDPFAIPALEAYRDAAQAEGGYDLMVEALNQILEGEEVPV